MVKSLKFRVRRGGCIHFNAGFISKYGFREGDELRVGIDEKKIVIEKIESSKVLSKDLED